MGKTEVLKKSLSPLPIFFNHKSHADSNLRYIIKISLFPGADNYSARQDILRFFIYTEENKSFSTERQHTILHSSMSYVRTNICIKYDTDFSPFHRAS
jgi:hypothetical protein